MKTDFSREIYVPDHEIEQVAMSRVTHMGIGAHQDDLEIFAYHGISECYESDANWFGGVTVADGVGSARSGPFGAYTDEQMRAVRIEEQNRAAVLGKYAFQAQLGYPSSEIKNKAAKDGIAARLAGLIDRCRPRVLYVHNPVDRHDTHIATLDRCIAAIRRLPRASRPERILGCEVWRDLDWLLDEDKVALPVDRYPELSSSLVSVFASQVEGGKDYVAATLGRRRANATFYDPHSVDAASAYTFAVDLTCFATDDSLTMSSFVESLISRFREDAVKRARTYA